MSNKLLLIDGNAILHRAYHALPPLSALDGTQVNAVYGFVSMLLRVVENLKPTHIAVAWDTAKPTFRHAEYTNYQAQRPRAESDLSPQFKITQDVLTAMHIPIFFLEGFEADDVIGTIAEQVSEEVIIVTGDRDILQLIDEDKPVRVFMPIKGLSEGKLYGEEETIERMGVKPSQIVDYKALVGDPSDNYPGVQGIGEKTAINLLHQFGTLEEIYKNLHLVPDRYAKKLAEGVEAAGISKRLATIVRDVPITCTIDDCAKWDVGSDDVVAMFRKIGFKSLTERAIKLG
jgi:DNA polymerase I